MGDFEDLRMHKDFPGISREFLVGQKVVYFCTGGVFEGNVDAYGIYKEFLVDSREFLVGMDFG